jgi:aryl-alcohol dehydrogenase-like predicted oxidoreductase
MNPNSLASRSVTRRTANTGDKRNGDTLAAAKPDRATDALTRDFASRFKSSFVDDFYRHIPAGPTISSLGMGTYLGECDDEEDSRYTDTLVAGVGRGLNLIDTAINYRCQRSERAVGRAIAKLLATGAAKREELVICTKGGFVPLEGAPPESRADYDGYLKSEYFEPGIMSATDLVAGGHCLTPGFLANQIERSKSNLGIDCIDIYYIHNPEQQLDTVDRARFLVMMRDAFAELESQVAAGRIASYGCATWSGFRVFAANRNYLLLTELVAIAREVGGDDHHFRTIQLPVNLAMTEAVRAPTQSSDGKNVDILSLALDLGISVIASASLMQAQLTRNLPDAVASHFPTMETDAQRAIAFVRSLPVASALVGMRSLDHLDENVRSGARAPVA